MPCGKLRTAMVEIDNSHEAYPYNLPMWSRYRRSVSPDGRLTATIAGSEMSMGSPTIGTLQVSSGIVVRDVNAAGSWSADSRFFSLPQWRFFLGLQLRQRLLVIDVTRGVVHASRALGQLLQVQSFNHGVLIVEADPVSRNRRRLSFRIPEDLSIRFRCFAGRSVTHSRGA
jgi:hypothetical protein